jgi:adenylate cyclase
MSPENTPPLASIEPRLRLLLPAGLYAEAWVDPSPDTLVRVFEHLRTLHRILYDYVPRQVQETLPSPGELRHEWQEGTLMFTDLAGFTPLMEANANKGTAGARAVLKVLNGYFAEMIEITSKAGGNLLEFTGDAMLIQFAKDRRETDTVRAVRAGLRMQRAMQTYGTMETDQGILSLGQRVGIHSGNFFTADIGTPLRMEHVLLGNSVQFTKQAEGAGVVGRVNLTQAAHERVKEDFRFEDGKPGYLLVIDDFTDQQLGEYDLVPTRRRLASSVLFDRSVEGLIKEIEQVVQNVEPLASFIPGPILKILVESAAVREIPPDFPSPTVLFVNVIGLPESVDIAQPEEEPQIVSSFSKLVAGINAVVEARDGVLKKVTYHLAGSDMMIMFGVPNAHTDDPVRAASAALAIREVIINTATPSVGGKEVSVSCQMGMARGPVFAAEIGEPRGRREFNILGDTVNTAARLMGKAVGNRILMTEAVYEAISDRFDCESLGSMPLKGKSKRLPIFALDGPKED